MASTYGYTTSTLVGTRMRTTFDGNSTPTDTEVDAIITEQEEIINYYAGRRFDSYTVTNEYHDHDGGDVIMVADPLVSVTTLEKTADNGDNWTTVDSNDYIVEADYQRIERKIGGASNTGSWPRSTGQRTVRVTYSAGYSSPPARIAALALDMSVLAVIRTLLNSQSNEEGGDIKVGPIEIGEPSLLTNTGYVSQLQSSVNERLESLQGAKLWTTVQKNWSLQ